MPSKQRRHPVESFFGKLRQWLASGGPGLAESKLARAELAAHLVRYNAAQTPVVGGVDEPALAPLRKGEPTTPLIVRTPAGFMGAPESPGHPLPDMSDQWLKRFHIHLHHSRELLN